MNKLACTGDTLLCGSDNQNENKVMDTTDDTVAIPTWCG